jgi:hypothetical protein
VSRRFVRRRRPPSRPSVACASVHDARTLWPSPANPPADPSSFTSDGCLFCRTRAANAARPNDQGMPSAVDGSACGSRLTREFPVPRSSAPAGFAVRLSWSCDSSQGALADRSRSLSRRHVAEEPAAGGRLASVLTLGRPSVGGLQQPRRVRSTGQGRVERSPQWLARWRTVRARRRGQSEAEPARTARRAGACGGRAGGARRGG